MREGGEEGSAAPPPNVPPPQVGTTIEGEVRKEPQGRT